MKSEDVSTEVAKLISRLDEGKEKLEMSYAMRKYAYDVDPYEGIEVPLRDSEGEDRAQRRWDGIIDKLAEIGEPAVEPLIGVVNKLDASHYKRRNAIQALGKIGSEGAKKFLREFSEKESGKY